jgi:hypothetical protein
MRVQFDRDEYRVAPGADVRLKALVSSDLDGPVDVMYGAEISGEQAAEFRLDVAGPSRLQPGLQTPVTVTVRVPRKATVTPEPRRVRLRATRTGSQVSASGETAVIVGGKRCAEFSALPELHVAADGTVTATVRVLNCGPLSLTLKLRARHAEGWTFDVDTPEMTLSAQSGPITVKVVLKPPDGRSVDGGDQVTLELQAFDEVLASKDVRIQRPPPTDRGSSRRRVGRVVAAGGVIAAVAIAAVLIALAALGSSGGSNPTTVVPLGQNVEPSGPPPSEDGAPGGGDEPPFSVEPVDIEIPFLLGMDDGSAVATLHGLGLVEDVVTGDVADPSIEPGRIDEGTVIAQAPAAGEGAEPGSVVTVTVTSEAGAILPDLIGRHVNEAVREIEELRLIPTGEPTECRSLDWLVTQQEPKPGTWVPLGSTVILTLECVQDPPSEEQNPPSEEQNLPTGGVE